MDERLWTLLSARFPGVRQLTWDRAYQERAADGAVTSVVVVRWDDGPWQTIREPGEPDWWAPLIAELDAAAAWLAAEEAADA